MPTAEQASRVQTWKASLARQLGTQQQVTLPIIVATVATLVVVPLLILIRSSLLPAGMLPLDTASFTLSNFARALWTPDVLPLLMNTAFYALGSVGVALLVSTALAWLVERTNIPFRTGIRTLIFIMMPIPPLAHAFGWILLLNPVNGAFNVLLTSLLGLEDHPFDVYSLGMMIFISSLIVVPTMFVMLSGVFRNMDPQFERAAAASGASYYRTLRHVTGPLLSPGLASTGIYMLMIMVQAFEVPLVIGLTARVPVLSVRIYLLSTPEGAPPEYGVAAVFGIALLGLALMLMWGYFRLTRVVERFRVVTGKGFRPGRVDLGGWRYAALAVPGVYVCLAFAPVFILLWSSFLPFYQVPTLDVLKDMSFANYRDIFRFSMTRAAFYNTLILVFSAASLTMLLSAIVSWFTVRRKGPASRWLEILSFSPIAIPNIVIALGILLLYIYTPLYGTVWVIVLAHVTAYMAFGTRTMSAALIQIHPELENAAIASGASWSTMMRRILLPMLSFHFMNGWLWVVAHSMRDVTMALILMAPGSMVLSSTLWLLWSFGDISQASALLVVMIVVLLVLVLPIQIGAFRRDENRSY